MGWIETGRRPISPVLSSFSQIAPVPTGYCRVACRDRRPQVEKGLVWIGSPADIAEQIVAYNRKVGGFEIASLQVNFNTLAL